jgi:hypothetical protein
MTEQTLSARLDAAFIRCRDMDAPLADRLLAFANSIRLLGPRFAAAVDALIERLAENDAGATAPRVGEPMPEFLLPDEQGRLMSLEDLLGAARDRISPRVLVSLLSHKHRRSGPRRARDRC